MNEKAWATVQSILCFVMMYFAAVNLKEGYIGWAVIDLMLAALNGYFGARNFGWIK